MPSIFPPQRSDGLLWKIYTVKVQFYATFRHQQSRCLELFPESQNNPLFVLSVDAEADNENLFHAYLLLCGISDDLTILYLPTGNPAVCFKGI